MNRFLRYSGKRPGKIRMMLMLNGQLAQKTALVLNADDQQAAVLQLGQRKQPVTVPLSDILSCDYARGDSGEDRSPKNCANGQKECDDVP